MAENRVRPVNRRQAIRTALAAIFGATVGASIGGAAGGGIDTSKKLVIWDIADSGLPNAKTLDAYDRNIVNTGTFKAVNPSNNRYGELTSTELVMNTIDSNPAGLLAWNAEDQGVGFDLVAVRPGLNSFLLGNYEATLTFPLNLMFLANAPALSSLGGFRFESDTGSDLSSGLVSAGAQVGLPTGSVGTVGTVAAKQLVTGGHRHAFSGRFGIGPGTIRDASLGGATPAKFTRLISNNNWTLRRLSVFALTAPAGTGSDTYGVINAAGTLQGTAVSLAVGATENATALQTTNLTGGTVYYFAVTARATTPALDVTLVPEYTMNI